MINNIIFSLIEFSIVIAYSPILCLSYYDKKEIYDNFNARNKLV